MLRACARRNAGDGVPYACVLKGRKVQKSRPEHFVPGGDFWGYSVCPSMAAWSFLFMLLRMGMASTMVSTSAAAWTEPTP